jgi:hypothetical protein
VLVKHLGGFTLIGGRLAAAGYRLASLSNSREERFARVLDQYRAQMGIQTISANRGAKQARHFLPKGKPRCASDYDDSVG